MKRIWVERELAPEYWHHFEGMAILSPAMRSSDDPYHAVETAHVVIAGGLPYGAGVLERAPDLLLIARTGIGYDKVDIAAATAAGVAVVNTPDGPTISTAECAITLMMSVARNVKQIEGELRDALKEGTKRSFYAGYRGIELYQKQLGLVGLGRIASHVAKIAKALGMKVMAYDPYVTPEYAAERGVELASTLEAVLQASDVVSVHVPLNDQTTKFMNAERFGQMKKGAIFINTARGGHVDEAALLEALESGHLWGAGLDVTDPEPPLVDNPLLYKENVVLTPHIASGTADGKFRIFEMAIEQVLMVLNGERPPHLVNPEVWPRVLERWQAAKLE